MKRVRLLQDTNDSHQGLKRGLKKSNFKETLEETSPTFQDYSIMHYQTD